MAKHAGKDMLIYLGDGASPEVFSLIVGLRSKSFSINNEQIDVSDSDDSRWRKLLEGGVRSCSLSGSGLLQSQSSHADCLQQAMDGSISNYRITFAASGTSLTGPFLLTTFEGSGEYTDAQQYSISLESAGDVVLDWAS